MGDGNNGPAWDCLPHPRHPCRESSPKQARCFRHPYCSSPCCPLCSCCPGCCTSGLCCCPCPCRTCCCAGKPVPRPGRCWAVQLWVQRRKLREAGDQDC